MACYPSVNTPSIERLPQWDERLRNYVEETKEVPRVWGQTDCALWSIGAVDTMCGTDLAGRYVGLWDSPATAGAYLQANGWRTLLDPVVELVGPVLEAGALHVALGDLVYVPTDDGLGGLGVLYGRVILPHHDKAGFRTVFLEAALRVGGCVVPIGDRR